MSCGVLVDCGLLHGAAWGLAGSQALGTVRICLLTAMASISICHSGRAKGCDLSKPAGVSRARSKNVRFGRPARGRVRPPVFYDNDGPRAACGCRVLVVLPSAYDPEDTDSCPECGKLVQSGAAWGRYMQPVPFRSCDSVVQIEQEAHACRLRHGHSGPHRNGGAAWETGPDDFVPAPDGYV